MNITLMFSRPLSPVITPTPSTRYGYFHHSTTTITRTSATSNDETLLEQEQESNGNTSSSSVMIDKKQLKKVAQKTAATFAPRPSTSASKNPAVPGSALYSVFEIQGYASMLIGGALSFNLIFPSDQPDLWRLMGMWSIWMFTIPSLRARDCSKDEKEALNYLFLLIPLLNVLIPFFFKSFPLVWSADVIAFFAMLDGLRERTREPNCIANVGGG
ncbi:hypothetical protein RIF29_37747 [Crotalaria pallida]|uniref:Uncharacterized protein n=1 Tax=Crotalaria pallida TaxID=3830 RepID=A0AAN9E3E7_CROPI